MKHIQKNVEFERLLAVEEEIEISHATVNEAWRIMAQKLMLEALEIDKNDE